MIIFITAHEYTPKNVSSSSRKTGSFELNAFINSPCVSGWVLSCTIRFVVITYFTTMCNCCNEKDYKKFTRNNCIIIINNSFANTSLIDANTVPIVKPSQILAITDVSNCLLIPGCYKYNYIFTYMSLPIKN